MKSELSIDLEGVSVTSMSGDLALISAALYLIKDRAIYFFCAHRKIACSGE